MRFSRSRNSYQFVVNPGGRPEVDGNRIGGAPRNGVAGQNNNTPFSLFGNHEVVRFGTVLFDPSYGLIYDGTVGGAFSATTALLDFENKAVVGFAVQGAGPFGAAGPEANENLWVRKNQANNVAVGDLDTQLKPSD